MFAIAGAKPIPLKAKFEEVVLSVQKMSEFFCYVVHIVQGFQPEGKEGRSLQYTERDTVPL